MVLSGEPAFGTSREVIQLAVMVYVRFSLSLRNVEGLLHERGIDVCHESIRLWVDQFGPLFAGKINGTQHYLRRAVDHEGEVLECYVAKKRDKLAGLRFLKKAIKRYGPPRIVMTDKLRSYGSAMRDIGNRGRQITEQYANNRAENSHQPFRQQERAMTRFRRASTLQKYVSVHASAYNHFNHQRHLESRTRFKALRNASLVEWRQLTAV